MKNNQNRNSKGCLYAPLIIICLLISQCAMAQVGFVIPTDTLTKSSIYSTSIYSIPIQKYPDTVKAGLMIANKRFSGRPRICIGTVIINSNFKNIFFDHKMRPVDRKRILWAQEIKPNMSY